MPPLLLILALSQAAAAAPAPDYPGPHRMTPSQIRTYNASLARDDPAYIRCRREEETGSLVRARSTCRTNAEWRRIEDLANTDARDMVDHVNSSGSSRGN